jgi:deoxyribodipyrimidine photo-lyase
VQQLLDQEGWHPSNLSLETRGQRSGWWGLSADADAFLDQLITWRELGYQFCLRRDDYDRFDGLPPWAQATLLDHTADPRPYLYSRQELETGQTHDPLWNSAQMQLVREGRLHNYLRMLWGKKILQWSASPQQALATMIELNDYYALDGCDPNSYSGIGWVLGRFDRAWGPQRAVFGKIRYMSSRNTARKVAVDQYIARYQP